MEGTLPVVVVDVDEVAEGELRLDENVTDDDVDCGRKTRQKMG